MVKRSIVALLSLLSLLSLLAGAAACAQEVTYTQHIRPLWEDKCERCHGAAAPTYERFVKFRDDPTVDFDGKGPRMDTYEGFLFFVNGPQAGALMRMLDDGSHTADGAAGSMYRHLGRASERKEKLQIFKQWVGEGAWVVKKPGELSKEEVQRIKAAK